MLVVVEWAVLGSWVQRVSFFCCLGLMFVVVSVLCVQVFFLAVFWVLFWICIVLWGLFGRSSGCGSVFLTWLWHQTYWLWQFLCCLWVSEMRRNTQSVFFQTLSAWSRMLSVSKCEGNMGISPVFSFKSRQTPKNGNLQIDYETVSDRFKGKKTFNFSFLFCNRF
jgi:hypothetical protein